MRGIVIHHAGGVRRSIEGRAKGPRLSVRPVLAPPPAGGRMSARPACFIFDDGGRVIAKSSRVLLARGRRYPGIEHWFVLPEEDEPGGVSDARSLTRAGESIGNGGAERPTSPAYGAPANEIVDPGYALNARPGWLPPHLP